MNQHEQTQQAFGILREIGFLLVSPETSEEVKKRADKIAVTALSVIETALVKTAATASGIIV